MFGRAQEWAVVRLLGEDVDAAPPSFHRLERADERSLVDQLAARGIDQPAPRRACAGSHPRRSSDVSQSVNGRCSVRNSARCSTSSNVALSTAELAEGARRGRRGRRPRPSSAARAHDARPAGPIRPKPRDAEHPCRPARRRPTSNAPTCLRECGMRLRNVAGPREQQSDGVLRGGEGKRETIRLRRVRNYDPNPRRVRGVHVRRCRPPRQRDRSQSGASRARTMSAVNLRRRADESAAS